MKEKMMKVLRLSGFWLGLIIVVQTILYLVAGGNKAYFHMDEIYSYGLSNYDHVQLYDDEEFYGVWHTGEYYDDYLTVGEDERGDFWPVYANQRDDVHPPLFYSLLRMGMELTPGVFSKWTGIVLNVIIFTVNTVVLYFMIRKLLGDGGKSGMDAARVRSLVLTFLAATAVAAVSTVIYIRMYALLTLWVTLTAYLHLKLLEVKAVRPKLLVGIGVVALCGILTQYYYAFFLAGLFGYFTVRYVRMKRWKEWRAYALTLAATAVVSLVIWPYSVQHLFFSNRGGGVLERFAHPGMLLGDLWQYLGVVDKYAFHYLLLVAILGLLFLGARALVAGKRLDLAEQARSRYVMLLVPALFYLLIVVAVSPFIELRYVAPVCGLLLVLVVTAVGMMLKLLLNGRWWRRVMLGILAVFMLMPIVTGVTPDVAYTERAEVVAWAQEMGEVPALYFTKGEGDWVFLNDILLFREFGDSYIVKDLQGRDVEKVAQLEEILEGKDLSRGLIVVVNDDYDKEQMMNLVEEATGLMDVEHVARMVTSDVYYIKFVDLGI